MPWYKDENGEVKYVPSAFIVEELPSWDEMYHEWWEGKIFSTDTDIGMDVYYTDIPRSKVLMAQACNQLNKMLYEDLLLNKNFEKGIYLYFKLSGERSDRFEIHQSRQDQIQIIDLCDIDIYTIPGNIDSPFKPIMHNEVYKRKKITDDEYKDFCGMVAVFISANLHIEIPMYDIKEHEFPIDKLIIECIKDLLNEMKVYFDGKPGWKDEDGNTISVKDDHLSCVTGYDPSL